MPKIKKVFIDGEAIYPRTVTDAVVDTETGEKLSTVIPRIRREIKRIVIDMPTHPLTEEDIDEVIEEMGEGSSQP